MGTLRTAPEVWQHWKTVKKLEIVAAFEDAVTGTRVTEFCQDLARELGERCTVAPETWPASELRMPQLCAIAAEEAAHADLVIVSVHFGENLPNEIKRWLDLWGRQKTRTQTVLLALLDPPYLGPSSSIVACLQEMARRKRIVFVAQSDDSAPRN